MTFPTRLIGQIGLLLAGATACTPALLPSGRYVETAAPGTLLLAGQTVTILDAHRFAYVRWSDDLASSHYGAGSYQRRGRTVRLLFEAPPHATQAQVLARPLPTPADSVLLTFLVESAGTTQVAPEPIPFATVRACDATGHDLRAVLTNLRGQATLHLARSAAPPLLLVASLGFATWRAMGPANSTAYHLQLPATAGTPYAAGTTKFFRARRLGGQWALREDPRQLPLLLQAPAK